MDCHPNGKQSRCALLSFFKPLCVVLQQKMLSCICVLCCCRFTRMSHYASIKEVFVFSGLWISAPCEMHTVYVFCVTRVACVCLAGCWSREMYLDDRFQHTAPHLPWYAANVKSEMSCRWVNITNTRSYFTPFNYQGDLKDFALGHLFAWQLSIFFFLVKICTDLKDHCNFHFNLRLWVRLESLQYGKKTHRLIVMRMPRCKKS